MLETVQAWLLTNELLAQFVYLVAIVVLSWLVYGVTRRLILATIRRLISRTKTTWDDALVDAQLFGRLGHLPAALFAYYAAASIPDLAPAALVLVQRVAFSLVIIAIMLSLGSFLTAANEIYLKDPENRERPIKGYLQVLKIVLYLVGGLLVTATLLDRSPLIFLSGIGALTAVLLLIFKDTILSLVASIQLTSNDMIHVGDWIEMPKYGADGDVVDVALHTVKVQNWDKTITTIPTHALIADSFKNWRGMSEAGGRRISRELLIDLGTIRFLECEEVERFGNFALLRNYIAEKRAEVDEHNSRPGLDPALDADIRRLTNVGTFRAYMLAYLKAHPKIRKDMTLLVRQLRPTSEGLPMQLYCFTNDTAWNVYEDIQADIFDHMLAIASEFDLRVFQRAGGGDLSRSAAVEAAVVSSQT
jgi:miniconductance mechanosensitive channel